MGCAPCEERRRAAAGGGTRQEAVQVPPALARETQVQRGSYATAVVRPVPGGVERRADLERKLSRVSDGELLGLARERGYDASCVGCSARTDLIEYVLDVECSAELGG